MVACAIQRHAVSSVMGRIGWAFLFLTVVLLPGCDPPYVAETNTTSTPLSKSFDTSELARMPVAVLAFVAPANLQGFSPTLSLALSGALTEVNPPIREISTDETINRLADQGLATEYADLRAGFARVGPAAASADWIGTWLAVRGVTRAGTV
jgi:hypothetical protein